MELQITTQNGVVEGLFEDGVRIWRGIPYAREYTGGNRFKAAKPAESRDGVLEAYSFCKAGPQLAKIFGGITEDTPTDENSLCLNIWAPAEVSEKLPVMLWIYGGAFVSGDGGMDLYDGAKLAETRDVIVVNFNYRLNAFGFLDFSSLLPEAESNVGIKDQLLALKWVYDNIAAFGGDRDNITIFGQSAGANSVLTLLSVPAARSYISRAIAMSAFPLSVATRQQAAETARRFLKILDIPEAEAYRLYTLPADELAVAAKTLENQVAAECSFALAFSPVADGDFLPATYLECAARPQEKAIPLVIGNVADEGSLYSMQETPLFPATDETLGKFTEQNGDWRNDEIRRLYKAYPRKKRAYKMGGDILFGVPTLLYADAYSRNAPVWLYRFSYVPFGLRVKKLYAMHGIETPFAFNDFGSGIASAVLRLTLRKSVPDAVKARFSRDLTDFAKTGQAPWAQHTEANRTLKDFNKTDRVIKNPLVKVRDAFVRTEYFRQLRIKNEELRMKN